MTQSADQIQGKPINSLAAGKLWHKQQGSISGVPTDLIEEKTLELLGVKVMDREDEIDICIPDGDIRFLVFRSEECIGTISTWVIGEIGYHPINYNKNPKEWHRFSNLFDAVCFLLPKQELEVTYREAFQILKQRFDSTPDYM